MFDKQAVEEYRSLTAPDALKQRVLQAAHTHKRTHRSVLPIVSTIAACLVLLFTANLWLAWDDAQDDIMISSNWTLDATTSLSVPVSASARTNAAQYATFTIAVRDKLDLDTDDTLFIYDESGTLISEFPHTTSEVVSVYWYITTPKATMTVNGVLFTLSADENNGTFQIVQD